MYSSFTYNVTESDVYLLLTSRVYTLAYMFDTCTNYVIVVIWSIRSTEY